MMAYESPITLIRTQTDNYIKEINEKTDEVIFKAVVNVLPQVDKDELIKALAYDREQYSKGYHDRDSEIVRCKDCKFNVKAKDGGFNPEDIVCDYWASDGLESDDFCSYGKRRGGEDE